MTVFPAAAMAWARAVLPQPGPGKPKVFHTRIRGARRHFAQLIPIQINKVDLPGLQLISQAALNEDQVRVPLVAGSFSHHHTLGTEAQKCLSGGAYEHGICVHLNAGNVFDKIGFEQDRLVVQAEVEQAKRPHE